jgi:hypothetical protein
MNYLAISADPLALYDVPCGFVTPECVNRGSSPGLAWLPA